MKCVHTFKTGRHKRQAYITLLFQYTFTHFGEIPSICPQDIEQKQILLPIKGHNFVTNL